jgi:hypothetical protein
LWLGDAKFAGIEHGNDGVNGVDVYIIGVVPGSGNAVL